MEPSETLALTLDARARYPATSRGDGLWLVVIVLMVAVAAVVVVIAVDAANDTGAACVVDCGGGVAVGNPSTPAALAPILVEGNAVTTAAVSAVAALVDAFSFAACA